MTTTLDLPDEKIRVVTPTTTAKYAARMLAASHVIASLLPDWFADGPAADLLLEMHIAEDQGRLVSIADLTPPSGLPPRITLRWIKALDQEGLVEMRDRLVALTPAGSAFVVKLIGAVFAAQRALD